MKAADFDYARAGTVEEACRLLAGAAGEARIIAGGQTLVPLLAMRLARPSLLVDINRIAELTGIAQANGATIIGAATRQADALGDALLAREQPLLKKALGFVGHPQTRNRGTIGGSLANADPAAEIALVARTLDAEMTARRVGGTRTIAAADFFTGAMTTALAPDECLTEVRFPAWHGGRRGTGFEEMSARRSDFALVAVACQVSLAPDGAARRVCLGLGGVAPAPVRASAAEARLAGTRLEADDIEEAMRLLAESLDPIGDVHASADYRRRVAASLAARALLAARAEAGAA